MTLEEMIAAIDALVAEGAAMGERGDHLLKLLPATDVIVNELWGLIMSAMDEFVAATTLDPKLTGITKVRDRTRAWLRHIEAVVAAPAQSIHGDIGAVCADLAKRGWLVDSGRRDDAGEIIWVQPNWADRRLSEEDE